MTDAVESAWPVHVGPARDRTLNPYRVAMRCAYPREVEMSEYAGRSHDERVAQRKREKKGATEPPGGDMAVHGTEPDATHSSGELSEQGKEVWRKGAGLDGGGKSD